MYKTTNLNFTNVNNNCININNPMSQDLQSSSKIRSRSNSNVLGSNNTTCIVGYALNPKKLRRSGVSTEIQPFNSSNNNNISTNIDTIIESTNNEDINQIIDIIKQKPIWKGGGLADILGDGKSIIDGVQFIPWDPEVPVHLQPKFQVLIHKLTEDIDRKESIEKIKSLNLYLSYYPDCDIVDPLHCVRKVISRGRTCECLLRIQYNYKEEMKLKNNLITNVNKCPISQPKFILLYESLTNHEILQLMKENGLTFPVICKPDEACGTPNSHSMIIIVSPSDLGLVRKPCVMQQFYNHDDKLYKIYVLGNEVMVYKRPSLPNLDIKSIKDGSNETIRSVAFDSRHTYPKLEDFLLVNSTTAYNNISSIFHHDLNKNEVKSTLLYTESNLNTLIHKKKLNNNSSITSKDKNIVKNKDSFNIVDATAITGIIPNGKVLQAATSIKEEFGLTLFGFDVIVPCNKGDNSEDMLIIDVNYFPSYKEVSDFPTKLRSYLRRRAGMEEFQLPE
jgi:inositol-1,3,4-trisphosphate 5/6-kinase/inositol-tetrakisphosphate 1-kinase